MSVFMIFRIAFKALSRNKMSTGLTMLGMIIGVAAVITMVALGTGAQSSIETQMKSTGTNVIMVMSGNFTMGGVRQGQGNASTLLPADAEEVAKVPGVQYASAGSNTRGQMVAGNQNWNTFVQGTDVDFPLIRSWKLEHGAWFTAQDVLTANKVVVLGSVVRDQLFAPEVNPVGQVIRIGNRPFSVVGVTASKGQSGVGQDQDDVAFVPYMTVMKRCAASRSSSRLPCRRSLQMSRRRSPTALRCSSGRDTRFSRVNRTISWCARWRRWRTCARKRRRR